MFDAAQTGLLPAREVVRTTPLTTAANGLRWASYGYTEVPADSLQQIVEAVPPALAAALRQRAYYFVPLALGESDETEIAPGYTLDLSDRATCHRNVLTDGVDGTFISARLMQDRFALAFEFFINIGHQFVDAGPVPSPFRELAWAQARADVRGETSQDAWEARRRALENAGQPATFARTLRAEESRESRKPRDSRDSSDKPRRGELAAMPDSNPAVRLPDDRAATSYFEAAFADTLAIYMLSLAMDLDYADLREREYPLLTAAALADRLRLAAELFPPAPGYEFAIKYRRRH